MTGPEAGLAPRRTLIVGARKVDAAGAVDDLWLLIEDGLITQTGSGTPPRGASGARRVDLGGAMLTPGLIDLHSHGAGGHSFDDGLEPMLAAAAVHRARGTTRTLISLVTAPLDDMAASVAAVEVALERDPGVLGAHLEGPFISPDRRGAHDPRHLIEPTPQAVDRVLEFSSVVRQITIAPELPGALEAISRLTERGIRVAVGHTEADAAHVCAAFDAGATLLTHAFNAMRPIHHREPGPVVTATGDPRVTVEVILDGVHVDAGVARMLAAAAPGRVALVSDAMAAASAADGAYSLGGLDVTVRSGVATLADGTIAGSTITLADAVAFAIEHVGLDEIEAVGAATATPARALGEGHRLGLIAPGFVADLVVWGEDRMARRVWVDGAEMDSHD